MEPPEKVFNPGPKQMNRRLEIIPEKHKRKSRVHAELPMSSALYADLYADGQSDELTSETRSLSDQ